MALTTLSCPSCGEGFSVAADGEITDFKKGSSAVETPATWAVSRKTKTVRKKCSHCDKGVLLRVKK